MSKSKEVAIESFRFL